MEHLSATTETADRDSLKLRAWGVDICFGYGARYKITEHSMQVSASIAGSIISDLTNGVPGAAPQPTGAAAKGNQNALQQLAHDLAKAESDAALPPSVSGGVSQGGRLDITAYRRHRSKKPVPLNRGAEGSPRRAPGSLLFTAFPTAKKLFVIPNHQSAPEKMALGNGMACKFPA